MGVWDDKYVMPVLGMLLYWLLVFFPHIVKVTKLVGACPVNDVLGEKLLSEKGSIEVNAEPRKAAEEFAASNHRDASLVRRAGGAHANGWENFTVFLSAVSASVIASSSCSFVNACCLIVLICRFLYNIFYLGVEGGPLSFVRSFCFMAGHAACVAMWVNAAVNILE